MGARLFSEIQKFNPYHDSRGRFSTANGATSFTYAPGKSKAHDAAIQRGQETAGAEKGFSGTLYHGSPETDIEEFDISRAGKNTSSGEKLIFFTDSKQTADDFSYERLDTESKFIQNRGKKGRVYEVDVEMKNPLDFRNLTDADIGNILKLDSEGLLTPEIVRSMAGNHQLLKASLNLNPQSLSELGYDGLIANMGKDGHNALEYAVISSKQAKIRKSASDTVLKFNPYHDSKGRFTTSNGATSFTYAPGKSKAHDAAIEREKQSATSVAGGNMKTVHEVEDKIRSQFYESAAVIDKDGNFLFRKDGAIGEVGFSQEERAQLKGSTVTHNHPDDTMLSTGDVYTFMRNDIHELRATTTDGTTYSIKRGEGYTADRAQRFVIDYDGEMKSARLVAEKETLPLRGNVMDGSMTESQFTYEYGKVVTREMVAYCNRKAKDYNIDFSVEHREAESNYSVEVYTGKSAGGEDMTNEIFNVSKTDADKRLVFGWASIAITADGEQLEDRQQDMIDPEDLEEAAYEYVLNFRDTGEEHIPDMRKKGKLVESCVFTAEKQKAMGIPEGTVPVGWWIGFKIEDDAAWEKVKNGTYRMFSIEGKAQREPVEKAQRNYDEFPSYDMWLEENLDATIEEQRAAKDYFSRKRNVAKTFSEILKFNPYHDAKGRFTSAGGGAVSAFPVDTPYSAAREKESVKCCAVESSEYKGIALPPSPDNRLTRYLDDEKEVVDGKVHSGIGHVQFMENGNLITSRSHSADDVKLAITDICERLGGCYEEGVFYRTTNNKNEIKLLESGKLMPSKNHLTGESEDGLSVWGTPKNMGHDYTYKVSGKIIGFGSDGEPVLDMSTLKVVGKMVNDNSYLVEHTKKKRAGEEIFKKTFNWTEQQLLCAKKGNIGNIFTGNGIVDIERMKKENHGVSKSFQTFSEILKFNPYHDRRGRFSTANGAASFTYKPGQGKMYDSAIAREKERTGGAVGSTDSQETPRTKALREIEDKIRNQNYESAAIIDRDGNQLLFKDGRQSSVGFSRLECAMMNGNTLTHNHPRCSMFSYEDLNCFTKNSMEEIRATNRDGITYSMKRGAGYTQTKSNEFAQAYKKEYNKAVAHAQSELDRRGFAEKIFSGEISHGEANREFAKTAANYMEKYCNTNAALHGLEFSVERIHMNASKSINADEVIGKAVGEIVLDNETDAMLDAAFNEWLDKHNIPKEK